MKIMRSIGRKILYYPLTRIITGTILITGVYGISSYLLEGIIKTGLLSKDATTLIANIISTSLAVITYFFLYRFYEKRKITEFSTKGIGMNLFYGVLLGMVLQSLTILVIYFKGGYSIVSINPILYIIPPFAMAFSSAIFEEIIFRGILFRITEEKLGSYIALIISALIFGALHLANPNSSLSAGVGIAIQAGLLLGAAYIYSKNLWFPIAIHFAWNFMQSAIFGANVSGNTTSKTLITSHIEGAQWFTGGAFGPEASIQATLFCLAATIVLLILSHKEGKIIKPPWKTSLNEK